MIRVVLADDHGIVRAGVKALLSSEKDIQVVGEAADGREAVEQVTQHRPAVLLVDLTMPGLNGVEAIARVRAVAPQTRILVLSMHGSAEHVRPALRAGAHGYLVKGADVEDLVEAIHALARGERFLSEHAAQVLEDDQTDPNATALDRLTSREREVLQLVAEGRTNREIAERLKLSSKTVDSHRTNLMRKLDVHDAQALTRFALRFGLISLD